MKTKTTHLFGKTKVIHFIGIGGSGMSGIAEILLTLGFKVTGSDICASDTTRHLSEMGAGIFTGHKADNVNKADVVVYSSAIDDQNPEIRRANAIGIPIIPRAEMLAELMRLKRGVAIAGTHGKTTTSSILGNIFYTAKLKPTTIIGGKVFNLGSNARLGMGELLICEADESDGSFLKLSPEIVVVTNIDNDHLDYYSNMKNLKNAFVDFVNRIPFYGFAVVCSDDKNIQSILPFIKKKVITYGKLRNADFIITNMKNFNGKSVFDLVYRNKKYSNIKINYPGTHNIYNSAAGVITALELGVDFKTIKIGLKNYIGVERRLEYVGAVNNIRIIDDYGHHPTEIAATLQAVSADKNYRKLIVVFQPHRYSRTRLLYRQFGKSFTKADYVIVTGIYAAGEKKIKGITSDLIFKQIRRNKTVKPFLISRMKNVPEKLRELVNPGDLILTLGAGDIKNLGRQLLHELKK